MEIYTMEIDFKTFKREKSGMTIYLKIKTKKMKNTICLHMSIEVYSQGYIVILVLKSLIVRIQLIIMNVLDIYKKSILTLIKINMNI